MCLFFLQCKYSKYQYCTDHTVVKCSSVVKISAGQEAGSGKETRVTLFSLGRRQVLQCPLWEGDNSQTGLKHSNCLLLQPAPLPAFSPHPASPSPFPPFLLVLLLLLLLLNSPGRTADGGVHKSILQEL